MLLARTLSFLHDVGWTSGIVPIFSFQDQRYGVDVGSEKVRERAFFAKCVRVRVNFSCFLYIDQKSRHQR